MDRILRMVSAGRQHVPGLILVGATLIVPVAAGAQGLTGALGATVKDEQGGVLPGADVTLSSPALIGGPHTATTNNRGHVRFLCSRRERTRSSSSCRRGSRHTAWRTSRLGPG